MSLMSALLLGAAHAGTAVWLEGTPDPALTPSDTVVRVGDAVKPDAFDASDGAAVQALLDETGACLPLLDEFDGELAIIQRLDRALEPVEVVRPADVEAVWQALVLQGLAVHRYFPDPAAQESTAAGVSRTVGDRAENRAWADAIALIPDRMPASADLADEAARLAYQEQRARALLVPDATFTIDHLPDDAVVRVDGQAQVPGTDRLSLVPGRHRIAIELGDTVHQRIRVDAESGGTHTAAFLAPAASFTALSERLAVATNPVSLPPAVAARAVTLDQPVSLVVPKKRGAAVFVIDGAQAIPKATEGASGGGEGRPHLHAAVGGGWVYDGDYLLQNHPEGAPEDTATVNAGAPVVHLSGRLPLGSTPLFASAGADLLLPLGDFHTLPSGERQLRLRAYPHLALGAGPVAVTAGWWTPWHLGVGLQGAVPVQGAWTAVGGFTQGIGLTRARDAGPDFDPATARMGWLGVGYAFGG